VSVDEACASSATGDTARLERGDVLGPAVGAEIDGEPVGLPAAVASVLSAMTWMCCCPEQASMEASMTRRTTHTEWSGIPHGLPTPEAEFSRELLDSTI
jgi:hypothetical protein